MLRAYGNRVLDAPQRTVDRPGADAEALRHLEYAEPFLLVDREDLHVPALTSAGLVPGGVVEFTLRQWASEAG